MTTRNALNGDNQELIREAAKAIRQELARQYDSRPTDGPYTQDEDPDDDLSIDGMVDLLGVASAALSVLTPNPCDHDGNYCAGVDSHATRFRFPPGMTVDHDETGATYP